jgi:hypothetical protein
MQRYSKDPINTFRVSPYEWAFMAAVVLAWAGLVVLLGKDTSWDFRNYHWYNAYAFLTGRMGFDVAVGHHATYYNPLLDLPYYGLATTMPSWVALAYLGAFQGLNFIPLYLVSRSALDAPLKITGAAVLALAGLLGGMSLRLTGTTYYDNVLSVFVLSGLAMIVISREHLATGSTRSIALIAGFAGLLIGAAVGLKLVVAPFALGFAAMLTVIPGTWQRRVTLVLAGGAGGLIGVALLGGFWFATLYGETGNPIFPYFNNVIGSTLIGNASYRDVRFVPDSIGDALIFPFVFSFDWRSAADWQFGDVRVMLAYMAVPVAICIWLFGTPSREPLVSPGAARLLFVFAGVSYLLWLLLFAIYRYIVTLEMLAPLLIAAAIGFAPVPRRWQVIATGVVLAAAFVLATYIFGARAPVGDPYVQISQPAIARPAETMVLMTGYEPMAYVIPTLPREIPVLRVQGFLIGPGDGTTLSALVKDRVAAHNGDLYLFFVGHEGEIAARAMQPLGLSIERSQCQQISSNLGPALSFCPLSRVAAMP